MSDVIDLKTFVAQTLIQIVEGVQEADKSLGGDGLIVNPTLQRALYNNKTSTHGGKLHETNRTGMAQMIDFDVAITASDSSAKEAGGGIGIYVVKAGVSHNSASQQQSVSHVKFFVPLALPKTSPEE